jgi:hypothetical protein
MPLILERLPGGRDQKTVAQNLERKEPCALVAGDVKGQTPKKTSYGKCRKSEPSFLAKIEGPEKVSQKIPKMLSVEKPGVGASLVVDTARGAVFTCVINHWHEDFSLSLCLICTEHVHLTCRRFTSHSGKVTNS